MLSAGTTLGGRYRLDERIAGGGMGDVWRGTDEVLGRTVAIKVLLSALMEEPGFAERFRGEARTMATINHPGVVDIYDYGSENGTAFLIMEYVEGDALSRTLSRVGRLTPARAMALVAQAADALHAAHEKGIVHRDVKPGNLLVRPNGTLVLTDFGIARSAAIAQLTAAGSVLGTASYISPEQASGAQAPRCPTSTPSAWSPTSACPASARSRATTRCRSRCGTSVTCRRRCPPTSRGRSCSSSSARWPRTRRPAGPAPPRSRRRRGGSPVAVAPRPAPASRWRAARPARVTGRPARLARRVHPVSGPPVSGGPMSGALPARRSPAAHPCLRPPAPAARGSCPAERSRRRRGAAGRARGSRCGRGTPAAEQRDRLLRRRTGGYQRRRVATSRGQQRQGGNRSCWSVSARRPRCWCCCSASAASGMPRAATTKGRTPARRPDRGGAVAVSDALRRRAPASRSRCPAMGRRAEVRGPGRVAAQAQGLKVKQVERDDKKAIPGIVLEVQPCGDVAEGSDVTLFYQRRRSADRGADGRSRPG